MSTNTRYVADVWCLLCARRAGSWEWWSSVQDGHGCFVPAGGDGRPGGDGRFGVDARAASSGRPRCPTCGGAVYLDEVQEIREFEHEKWGPAKRGRKPKQREAVA